MKKISALIVIVILAAMGWGIASIVERSKPAIVSVVTPSTDATSTVAVVEENLSQVYKNSDFGITMRFPNIAASTSEGYPDSYKVDESYEYQLSPEKVISGVKFTIPAAMATGTNLGADSYISIEQLPKVKTCSADLFLDGDFTPSVIVEDILYSVATSSNAGAGNRYEETVYAIPGTSPCLAVRYFVHYSAFQNYPEGSIKEFDQAKLIETFDRIRRTLVIGQ